MNTKDLTGSTLDLAVATALGYFPARREKRGWGFDLVRAPELGFSRHLINAEGYPLYLPGFEPSTQWLLGGPIIERERIATKPFTDGIGWFATMPTEAGGILMSGPTALVAAMRCFVHSRLGTEVDIPPKLL